MARHLKRARSATRSRIGRTGSSAGLRAAAREVGHDVFYAGFDPRAQSSSRPAGPADLDPGSRTLRALSKARTPRSCDHVHGRKAAARCAPARRVLRAFADPSMATMPALRPAGPRWCRSSGGAVRLRVAAGPRAGGRTRVHVAPSTPGYSGVTTRLCRCVTVPSAARANDEDTTPLGPPLSGASTPSSMRTPPCALIPELGASTVARPCRSADLCLVRAAEVECAERPEPSDSVPRPAQVWAMRWRRPRSCPIGSLAR